MVKKNFKSLLNSEKSYIICESFVHCSHWEILCESFIIFDSIMPFVNTIKRFLMPGLVMDVLN